MLNKQSTYQSKVFREFKLLDRRDYGSMIRFYERNQKAISTLNINEHIILLSNYTNALFQTEHYQKHLNLVDDLIEESIFYNVQYYQGEDIYVKALFQKAQSYYFIKDYNNAQFITIQLIKIHPEASIYHQFLNQCLFKNTPERIENVKTGGSLLALVALGTIVINLLVITAFFPSYVSFFNFISLSGIFLGLSLFVLSLAVHLKNIKRQVKKIQVAALERKKEETED